MLKALIKKYLYVVIIEIRFSYMIFCCTILNAFHNLYFTYNFAFLLLIKIHTIMIFELYLNWIIPLSRFPWFRSWETPSLFKFKTLTHVTSHYTLPGFFSSLASLSYHTNVSIKDYDPQRVTPQRCIPSLKHIVWIN